MTREERDEVAVATAALLGGHPAYYDYGHPERATARQYWTIDTVEGRHTIYGYTRAECARKWLRETHPEVKLP